MGMIAQRRIIILKYFNPHYPTKPSAAIIAKATKHMTTKSTLVIQFTSRSSCPVLFLGLEMFIAILVSLPVWTIIPRMYPGDARTVFAQSVFSKPRPSSSSS